MPAQRGDQSNRKLFKCILHVGGDSVTSFKVQQNSVIIHIIWCRICPLVSCWLISGNLPPHSSPSFPEVFDAVSDVSLFKLLRRWTTALKLVTSVHCRTVANLPNGADGGVCWCKVVCFISLLNNVRPTRFSIWWGAGGEISFARLHFVNALHTLYLQTAFYKVQKRRLMR